MPTSTPPRLRTPALLLAAAAAWAAAPLAAADAAGEIGVIGERMLDWAQRTRLPASRDAAFYNERLRSDGGFSDNPDDTEASLRLAVLGQALHSNGGLRGDADLRRRLGAGIGRWLGTNRRTGDFVPDAFLRPRYIGAAGLLAENAPGGGGIGGLRGRLADYLTTDSYLAYGPEQFEGANVTYRLDGMIAGAVFEGTAAAFDRVDAALDPTFAVHGNVSDSRGGGRPAVGLTSDGAWLQHNAGGGQMFWIGYGRDWANGVRNTHDRLGNTRWEPTDAEIHTVADGYLDGHQWMFFKGQGLSSVGGRHGLKEDAFENADRVAGWYRDVAGKTDDPQRRGALLAAAARMDGNAPALTGHKHFHTADTTVHSRPDWYVGIRTSSIRTGGAETGNGDGLGNYHMADGTTLIMRDGDEYDRVRAAWDVKALPGVTAARTPGQQLPEIPFGRGSESNNAFSGGVSDGLRGVTAFKHDRDDPFTPIRANKGYFLFDDEVVALGNLIRLKSNAAEGQEVWTTLNQTEMRSDVTYAIGDGPQRTIARGADRLDTLAVDGSAWFHQDGVGYLVFTGDTSKTGSLDVRLQTETRTGDWSTYNAVPAEPVTVDVFQLSIDHGALRREDRLDYGYIVVPGVTAAEMAAYAADVPVEVIQNNFAGMAVRHAGLGLEQVVFDRAGSVKLSEERTLASEAGLIVMLRESGEELTISLSDPNRTLRDVELTITDHLLGEGAAWDAAAGLTTLTFELPGGIDTGATLTRTFTLVVPEPTSLAALGLGGLALLRRRRPAAVR